MNTRGTNVTHSITVENWECTWHLRSNPSQRKTKNTRNSLLQEKTENTWYWRNNLLQGKTKKRQDTNVETQIALDTRVTINSKKYLKSARY